MAQLQGSLLGSEYAPPADRGRNTSVLERERPEYEARGIREGSFLIFPRIVIGGGYSDNVYGLTTNEQDDAFLAVDPSVSVESQWGRHALTFQGGGRFRRFAEETPKNETGFNAAANGRLDIDRATTFNAGASIQKLYEQRASGSFPVDALASVPFYRTSGFGRLTRQGGPIRGILGIDYDRLSFKNVRAIGGGTLVQRDRNRDVIRATGRADYALTPDISAFGQLSYATVEYERPLANGLANRDGKEGRVSAGVSFDLTALIRGEVGVGYIRRAFDSGLYPDIGGVAAEARVEYFVTPLTTLSAVGRRYIEDSNILGSGGFYANVISAGVDHELLRNLLLNGRVEYESDDFQGIVRKDGIFSVSGGARYFMNRNVGVGIDAGYIDRRSNDNRFGIEYKEFHGSLSFTVQL
jgi:hypothetical protein